MLYQKIYVTDTERNLTFFGSVKSMDENHGMITICLLDVAVYEYSSSNYLYHEAEVSFSRPKSLLFVEEA
ncbi:hypothetical protein SAMN05216490_2402 [Mucilaginibacter mallensis]|uniref:Uncharacterized protein n=1 Tax=Mucilaginibacter mallensis TaxID=652787 RepID=A0A1H1XAE4_MUCMA|nr:hypothetical protein SAMN05216490_2402 [Mucilaginibacter mallensis]